MVRDGNTESLSGINVSSCVVVTLGVFRLLLRGGEGGEEEQSGSKSTQQLLLYVSVGTSLHCSVSMEARSLWMCGCVSTSFLLLLCKKKKTVYFFYCVWSWWLYCYPTATYWSKTATTLQVLFILVRFLQYCCFPQHYVNCTFNIYIF